jgi:class 3 adenylate cyclase/ABC-type nitrate/sulfonate/bicarbonate transport system substrate-binding protein
MCAMPMVRRREARRFTAAAILAPVVGLLAGPCLALDKVSLQLKWLHQFQFAGYYAALEQGFYRDASLDVEIREGGPNIDAMKAVQEGKADFGVCTTSVLLEKPDTASVVVLGVIFQHSPAILLVPSRARVGNVRELKGRKLMDTPGSDDIAAMLKHEGVDYASLPRVPHYGDPRDLADGKADAMVAYSTNEPFILGQLGVPYRTFSPRASGFDFYGDNLCTSADQLKAHPDRVRAFLGASLKGWAHALAHKEQTADLILDRYSKSKSRDALLFEAVQSEALIQPHLIPLGNQTAERWQSIANGYRDLGMLSEQSLPRDLIYRADRSWMGPARLLPWLISGAVGLLLLWPLYRWMSRRLELASRKPKLSAIMAVLFVGLTIPVLLVILVYNYHRNTQTMLATLKDAVAKTSQASIENVEGMIHGVGATVQVLAEIAATDLEFYRAERSREVLFRALTSAEEMDAAFVSFEDGFHRAVTRIDADRRRSDPKIPETANWHSNYIDPYSAGENRSRRRTFYDTWGHVVGGYDVPTTVNYRAVAGYPAAKATGSLAVADPEINVDTGYPIINIRAPIYHGGGFIGAAGGSITLDVLSRFLASHHASVHSATIIADPGDGKIIAASERKLGVKMVDGKLQIARLENVADEDVREAYRLQTQTNQDNFLFVSPRTGEELSASFTRFPESFGHPWEAIVLTPTDDFIGPLKATNREIVLIIVALSAVELLLIYVLALRLSRPIENISRDLKSVESLSFEAQASPPSKVREIAQLQSAAALLRNSLKSFSSFAPVDVVRGLVKSGIPLSLGVEKRSMTILFSDLENFSTQAEQATPDELLARMSVYFEQVSRAISDEEGTVDKFIGDGVMAFWGAPQVQADHAIRACRGALRAVRRMEKVNEAWRAEGKPIFRIRIGLNSADVLVGNVGSAERFSYTVMGDGVNVASRLEGVNKQFGTSICISDSVVEAAGSQVLLRPLRKLQVKGRRQEFMVYELLGIRDAGDPELAVRPEDVELCDLTSMASAHLENGRIAQAVQAYRRVLERFPNDRPSQIMLEAISASEFA